ncbi:MAG: DUF2723 domain-containing protein [Anaerolineae bacterium]|nr:DUF2723 domain-containing protein [Anaerolineae bacterium]
MNEGILTIKTSLQWHSWLKFFDWRFALAFGLPFSLYILTLAPTVYNLDSAELTTAAATGGLVRATGYPLYLVLGWLWSWLPVGDVGYRMNLFSAFTGALTVALASLILRRWRVGPWAMIGALGLLACAPFFWALSLIAEVYTLHTALMAGIILLLLHWSDQPAPARLASVVLLVGLSLGHHVATVLLLPGCAWYILTVHPRQALAPRAFLPAVGALLVGLSIYLYLPWRYGAAPAFNYAGHYDASGTFVPLNLQTPQGIWWLLSGRAFAGSMWAYQGAELWGEIGHFVSQLWRAFFIIGIGPGLVGLVVLLRRDWRLGCALLLMFGFNAAFYIDYRVIDKDTMFLPTYLIWALWVGIGYQWMLDWTNRQSATLGVTRVERWLLPGVMVGAVLVALSWNWHLVDLSDDWSARERGEEILHELRPNALIFGYWQTVPLIEYLQFVEGQRPDVKAINRFLIAPEDMRRLIQHEITRRPVYVDSIPPQVPNVEAKPVGPVYRLLLNEVEYVYMIW